MAHETVVVQAPASPAATWAFGIEIECYMPVGQAFEMGRYHHGRQIRGIDSWTARGWTAESDSSVISSIPGYVGVEIVSPKLYGEDGLSEVVCMIDWLQEIGARVDSRCGQHVSVDAVNLTMEQVTQIRETFRTLERGLFLVNGSKAAERWQSSYCVPMTSGLMAPAARYWALNITNYAAPAGGDSRRRLEFRLWAGTLDAAKSVSYILASVGLVVGTVQGTAPATVPADAIGQLRTIVKSYILAHRIVGLDSEVDLTDICRDLVKTGREGVDRLAQVTGRP